MNTATANPEIDIANGKEAGELLGQSVGFENELIGQSNFPHQPSLARYAAIAIFPNRQVLLRRLGNRPGPPPPGANMPSTPCLVQGGKLGMRGVAWSRGLAISRIAQGPYEMGCATASAALLGDPGKSSLTVFRRNLCAFSRFHQKFPPRSRWFGVLHIVYLERIAAVEFESANPQVVKSIKQRDLLNTWLRLYAREQLLPRVEEYQPERLT